MEDMDEPIVFLARSHHGGCLVKWVTIEFLLKYEIKSFGWKVE